MVGESRDPGWVDPAETIHLRILVPSRVFQEHPDVVSLVIPTRQGRMGFLPHRLDCVAAVIPGILDLETAAGVVVSLAIDEGVLVKSGLEVLLAVRHALGGRGRDSLIKTLRGEFESLAEREQGLKETLARMESSFLHRLSMLHPHG